MADDLRRVELLLEQCQQPDKVKQAEKSLKEASASPQFLVILLRILFNTSSSDGVRQLAAVQARKQAEQHWHDFDASLKPDIRNKLLEFNLSDAPKVLLHSTAEIICAIAEVDSEHEGAWTELPDHLIQATQSPKALHREMALYITYLIMLNGPEVMAQSIGKLIPVLKASLQDPESADVRVNALLTFGEIASNIDTENEAEVAVIQECVPAMLVVLKDAVASGDEERATKCFEMFQQTLVLASVFFNVHFKEIMMFMLQVMNEPGLDPEMKLQAIYILIAAVNARKIKLQSLRLGEEIALQALQLVVNLDQFDDDGEKNPARQALALLDLLAAHLPPNQVVLPLMTEVGKYSTDKNPDVRRAGILALGMCVEGAPDFFSTQLKDLMPLVLTLLQDDSPKVRGAALQTVARLAEELSEEIGVLHETLIPAILDNFDAGEQEMQSNPSEDATKIVIDSCIALESLVEGMEKEDVAKDIDKLLPRLSRTIQKDDYKLKIVSVAAIGAVAAAAEDGFTPYFKDVMQGLGVLMLAKDSEDEIKLRQTTTDAIGKIALAVGPEDFEDYVEPLMRASEEALHLKDSDLRESSYILWSQLAKVYGEKFKPFLPGVVKALQDTLEQDEGVITDADFKDIMDKINKVKSEKGEEFANDIESILAESKAAKTLIAKDDEDSDDDDMDAGDDDDDDSPATAIGMEKEIALEVLGDVLSHTKTEFLPYFEASIKLVHDQLEHHYPGVRQAAIGTLWRAYATLWQIEKDRHEEAGAANGFTISSDLQKLGAATMEASLQMWEDEGERSIVTDVQRNLGETLDLCGVDALGAESNVPKICKQILLVIQAKHPCQQDDDIEDDEEAEEFSEYDWLVIETAMDCLVSVAKAIRGHFAPLWPKFEKAILKHVSSQESGERAAATGTVAECIRAMDKAVTPYTQSLMKVAIHRMNDEDLVAKANAIYATGMLCQFSEDTAYVLKQYPAILRKLEPQLVDDASGHLLDNAAGCVARMIIAHPDSVPLDDVLPVLLNLAPAKEDWEVNGPIYQAIVLLVHARNPSIGKFIPQVKVAVEKILAEPEEQLDDETRSQVTELAQFLQSL